MKKNANYRIKNIKTKLININQISQNNLLYSQYKTNQKFLFIYIFILLFSNSFLKKIFYLRKINIMQEITLTIVNNVNDVTILNEDFSPLPDEIYIGEQKLETISRSIHFNNQNTIKLCYYTTPNSLQKMFKSVRLIKSIDFSNFDTSNVQDMSYMLNDCQDIENINFNNFKTSNVKNMENMFCGSQKIKSLDLSSFDTSSVLNMKKMFTTCEGLISLNILSFDTSQVTDMVDMFCDCQNLEYLDISSFRSNNQIDMGGMFKYCLNLKSINFPKNNKLMSRNMGGMFQDCQVIISLDLSCFDTSKSLNMDYMFDQCFNLRYLDLSSFNTNKVQSFAYMFSKCYALQSLDLSNFNTVSIANYEKMFLDCNSLIYLNFNSLIIYNSAYTDKMFAEISNSTALCLPDQIKTTFTELNIDCENNCFKKPFKLIEEKGSCVQDCNSDNTYKYEYNNKCYKDNCPEGTASSSTQPFLCKKILTCPNYSNLDKTECFDNIPEGYFLSDINQKLIDKCHENCRTCKGIGADGNNNCLTCRENLFYDNGNCLINCTYGSFIIYEGHNSKNICACSNKCKECSSENNNLCKSCNQGYYPKNDQILKGNTFFDCYNALEELEGYYYNNNYFYPCYKSCNKCSNGGDDDNHNCEQCRNNYNKLLNENVNENNCYLNCNDNYYYFDSNNIYKCTTTKQCPDGQNKLIRDKNKCIDSCIKDNKYKIEYNNECVE